MSTSLKNSTSRKINFKDSKLDITYCRKESKNLFLRERNEIKAT